MQVVENCKLLSWWKRFSYFASEEVQCNCQLSEWLASHCVTVATDACCKNVL